MAHSRRWKTPRPLCLRLGTQNSYDPQPLRSPVTNELMQNTRLVTNWNMKSQASTWLKNNKTTRDALHNHLHQLRGALAISTTPTEASAVLNKITTLVRVQETAFVGPALYHEIVSNVPQRHGNDTSVVMALKILLRTCVQKINAVRRECVRASSTIQDYEQQISQSDTELIAARLKADQCSLELSESKRLHAIKNQNIATEDHKSDQMRMNWMNLIESVDVYKRQINDMIDDNELTDLTPSNTRLKGLFVKLKPLRAQVQAAQQTLVAQQEVVQNIQDGILISLGEHPLQAFVFFLYQHFLEMTGRF